VKKTNDNKLLISNLNNLGKPGIFEILLSYSDIDTSNYLTLRSVTITTYAKGNLYEIEQGTKTF
jgi:hypothetical protein